MDLEVAPLEIRFTTNIPNQKLAVFTSDLLYHPQLQVPSNIESLPYLISNSYFPEDVLKNMEWEDRISFFFNLDVMRNIMNKEMILIKEESSEKQLIENRNIFIMIKLLFPTKYFVHKNIHQTLEYVTGENPERSFFFNPLSQQFSHMKLDGKIYTNIRVTWKNDLLNHPFYYDLVKNTYEFVIKQKKEDIRITENYSELMIKFNKYLTHYVSRMIDIVKKYDEQMTPNDEQNYHTVMRIAIVNAIYEWINYENTDTSFSQIFIMNIKSMNNELQNKIGEEYYTPRNIEYISKPIFDMIADKDGYINSISDPLQRKKEKLMLVFNEDQEVLINRRLMKKLENTKKLADMIDEYTLYFEKQESEMKDLYKKLIKELDIAIDFQKYKRTPFLEVASKPETLKNNTTYRRYFVDNIEKLLDSSSSTNNSIITGNHKLYEILHSNNTEDVEYFFSFMESLYEKYIMYKTVSMPLKKGIESHNELIYTGVDNIQNKKQVYFIIDTIDGEVNDNNKRNFYCPFMNEYMGYLLSDFVEPNTFVKWKASPYNFILSTSEIEKKIKASEEEQLKGLEKIESKSEPEYVLTGETLDDNWEKFKQIINIASREKIIDNLLYLKKERPSIDETNEFAFIEQNKPSLFSALKNISKHIKKRDLQTVEFKEKLQRLKELASIHNLRFVDKSKQLDNLPMKQMDQMDQIKTDQIENELYSIIANNAVQYFTKKGGNKTRKKVKFSKKNNIVFIE